ncbi:MAG: hypothetical protein ACE5KK_08110, partial [Candidatus Brocadiales bacterium]
MRVNRFLSLGFILACLILSGCASAIKMDVRSYSDPTKTDELEKLKTFAMSPASSFDPLQEKELLFLLRNKLVSKGFTNDEKNPDFVVSIDFSAEPVQIMGTALAP